MTQDDRETKRGAPVKVTILYEDGSENESNVFMAVLARGIVPIARYDEQVFYMADGDEFSAGSVCSMHATTDVVGTLLHALSDLGMTVIETAKDSPGALHDLFKAMTDSEVKSTDYITSSGIREIRPEDN